MGVNEGPHHYQKDKNVNVCVGGAWCVCVCSCFSALLRTSFGILINVLRSNGRYWPGASTADPLFRVRG